MYKKDSPALHTYTYILEGVLFLRRNKQIRKEKQNFTSKSYKVRTILKRASWERVIKKNIEWLSSNK